MKVLVAIDDDSESNDAVHFVRGFLPEDAEVLVLNVTNVAAPPATLMSADIGLGTYDWWHDDIEARQAAVDKSAEALVGEIAADFPHGEGMVTHGDAGTAICRVATEQHVDLIALGTHDRGVFSRLWYPSVADHVVHHAPCPVLVVRGPH